MTLISKRAQQFETSGVRALFDTAAKLKDPISFAIGQPDFGPSEKVKQKTIEAINQGFYQYTPTQGIGPLRKKIAEKFQKENNLHCTEEDIMVTPGTSAAFFLALSAILDAEDEVIIPDPYFVEYPMLVQFLGGKSVLLDTYPDFQIDINKLKSLISPKTKAIIINSPNNPTGVVYSEDLLREIAQVASENDIIIISDEIYEKFVYDDAKHFSIGSIYPNTITLNGLSKSGGMPGWRLAWATGPQEIISKMKDIQQYTFVNAPSIVQHGALEAFEDDRNISGDYQAKRDLVCSLLSPKFKFIKPQGAFYVMVQIENGTKFSKWAVEQNVLVVPGGAFSQKDTHVRISFATSEEKIRQGIEILLKY